MTLAPGARLGPYEVTAKLGEGGMGEVWRATDTKLRRDVAVKVLPAAFTEDRDRLARFEREAQLLAQLNHANVAQIYGLEASGEAHALVMELVEGPTLAERLASGALPLEEALAVARQIAEALEEAHAKGIIHRDLKPQNVKVTADGKVKVLDFGLAKAMDPATGASGATAAPQLTASPTLTVGGTVQGVILGTAAYMSPEQAKGAAVDKRADIWAFGVVLHEMLTGRRLFDAPTVPETLAQVLTREQDLDALPPSTPPAVRRLLRRCLERSPKNRLHDIADARLVLDDLALGRDGEAEVAPALARPARAAPLPWAIAAAAVAAALIAVVAGRAPGGRPTATLTRTSILAPTTVAPIGGLPESGMFALSPDGSAIALVAGGNVEYAAEGLLLRELDQVEAHKLPGTEGATYPFWSPDSREIGFFSGGALRRVPRGGGAVQTICPAPSGRGGSWSPDGTIVFAPAPYSALLKVPASGGVPVAATRLDADAGDRSHRFPSFLPDGRHFFFGVEPWKTRMPVRVSSLEEVGSGRPLLGASAVPRFAAPDQLVFLRDQALMAQTIDLDRLEMTGEARQLGDRPNLLTSVTDEPPVDFSNDGKMIYTPVDPRPASLAWYDLHGSRTETPVRLEGGQFFLAVSHRGDRLVAATFTSVIDGSVWILDPARGDASRITPPGKAPWDVVWSPDDRWVVTNMGAEGVSDFGPALVDVASGEVRRVVPASPAWIQPTDVSADGRFLVYEALSGKTRLDVGWMRLDEEPAPAAYAASPAQERGAKLSPDGRFLAYLSDASGRLEVYVDAFPTPSRARRVETGGAARQVAFRDDGRVLFILADSGGRATLFATPLEPGPELGIGRPQKLFSLPPDWLAFAPAPSGDRFYLLERPGSRSLSLTLVQNWRAQLARPR